MSAPNNIKKLRNKCVFWCSDRHVPLKVETPRCRAHLSPALIPRRQRPSARTATQACSGGRADHQSPRRRSDLSPVFPATAKVRAGARVAAGGRGGSSRPHLWLQRATLPSADDDDRPRLFPTPRPQVITVVITALQSCPSLTPCCAASVYMRGNTSPETQKGQC
jgi:hypothetical protein